MFGTKLLEKLLEGMFRSEAEVSTIYAFALGQRVGRRCHYGATTLKMMEWIAAQDWTSLREWLLKDLPNEEPLPDMRAKR